MSKNPYMVPLTAEEADRAIYIDFEGRKGEEPALLGTLYFEGRKKPDHDRLVFRHDILDDRLHPMVDEVRFEGIYSYQCLARTLGQAVRDIVRRATNQRRPIVAWSQHEIVMIKDAALSDDLESSVEQWFRNGIATVRRWRRELHPDWVLERDEAGRANRLGVYLDHIGYEVAAEHRGGHVGETIKATRDALSRGGGADALTDLRQRRWLELLAHNFQDCNGMRVLVQRAATELAAADTGQHQP